MINYLWNGKDMTVFLTVRFIKKRLYNKILEEMLMLRIERSVSVCLFNIAIVPISFFNAKRICISLESLMIELYLLTKIYFDYFLMPNLENQCVLHFEFQCQKLLRLHHNTYILLFCIDLSTKPYQGLWFNGTHLLLFQNMSVKTCANFFFSLVGSNFKINYLKDKMRYGMWVYILWNNLASSP